MARRSCSCYRDLLPFVVLVTKECISTGVQTLFKAATQRGMSSRVSVAYAYAVATIILFPVPFLTPRIRMLPPLSFSILSKIALLGVIGSLSQMLGYAGISYSSPTLSSATSNLVPAFTFLLAVIFRFLYYLQFRMEKIAVKSSSQAKVLGSIISISGAFVMTFYKGPSIIIAHGPLSYPLQQPISILHSVDRSWAIGGLLLIADYLLLPLCLSATTSAATVAAFTERNPSAWKIGLDMSLISIVSTVIFSKVINNITYAWALHLKGPVYVAIFKPLSIVIAVAIRVMFLGDTLHIGSIVGATIISIGFYTVIWGKATEETGEDFGSGGSPSAENIPLLQS